MHAKDSFFQIRLIHPLLTYAGGLVYISLLLLTAEPVYTKVIKDLHVYCSLYTLHTDCRVLWSGLRDKCHVTLYL